MTVPLTVGVNLLWLVPGVVGGSEEYTLRLLRALDDGDHGDLRLRVYGTEALLAAHPDLAERFPVVTAPRALGRAGRVAVEHSWLAAASRHDDLVHHAGGVVPAVRLRPAVLTIHDLQPLDLPDNFSTVKRRWLGSMLPRSARAARLVITPSRFSADRVHDRLGVDRNRLRVVAHGHNPDGGAVPVDPATEARIDGYGRFVLYPAISYPHKRHIDLIEMLDRLGDRHPELHLVLTGRPGPEHDRLRSRASDLGLTDRVHLTGRVPEAELDRLYRRAAAVAFPSSYEGFGNPLLEAMARDTPVVTSGAGSLPEVAGGAAIITPVGDPDALADAVGRVLDEPGLADRMRRAGRRRAGEFGWDGAGRQLAGVYRDAAALRPGEE
ncbi:MAG: glycosyltransferase family 4 protein [Acidimicrobiales bacterium]